MNYRVPPHIYYRALQDEVILLNVSGDVYLGLNRSAAVTWNVLAAGGSPAEAVDEVTAKFEVDAETARHDVETLIATLVDRGLLVTAPA